MQLHCQFKQLGWPRHRLQALLGGPAGRPFAIPQFQVSPALYYGTLQSYRDCTVVDWLRPKEEYTRLHLRQTRQHLPRVYAMAASAQEGAVEQAEQPSLSSGAPEQESTAPHSSQPEQGPLQHAFAPALQLKGEQFDARKHVDAVFPVGLQEVKTVAEMVAIIKKAQNPTAEECVHMVCRMGQLVAQHCKVHKRLEVQESRETRTAMEKIDDLLLKVPMVSQPPLPDGTRTFRKPAKPSRLVELGPYPALQLTNGLLDMVLARRPKVHRVAFSLVAHIKTNDLMGNLPEEQRWPCWSMLMFNLSDMPDTNCKVTPFLQQLLELGMVQLEPLMTSPELCPANCLSSFLLAAAKNKLNFKEIHKEFIVSVENAIKEGRVMGDACAQDWIDLQWSCMQLGYASRLLAQRAALALLDAPEDKITGRNLADLLVGLMAAQWYDEEALRKMGQLVAHKVEKDDDSNAQVCGDALWALSALGWYDFDVYDRIVAFMAKFESKDPRANARVLYSAALARHFSPATDELCATISQQKRLNGWAPHEQADLLHGWSMLRATGQCEDARGMLMLFRALLVSVHWHKTPSHYRKPDHLRLHESRQLISTMAFGAPGLPAQSKILMGSAEVAERVALQHKQQPSTPPQQQAVERAVVEALRKGGAQVLENVVVGGSVNVGVLMGNKTCKRGIAVDILDETSYMCHPPGHLTGTTILRHALLRDFCDGLLVLNMAECMPLVEAGDEEGLVALLARSLQEAKQVSEQLAQEQQERMKNRAEKAKRNAELRAEQEAAKQKKKALKEARKKEILKGKLQAKMQAIERAKQQHGQEQQVL